MITRRELLLSVPASMAGARLLYAQQPTADVLRELRNLDFHSMATLLASLATDDRRNGRRVVTSLPATLRKANLGSAVQAAYVVDLSVGGVRLLLEMDDATFGIDHEVDLVMGHITARAWVRHIASHDNPRLRYIGLEFAPLSADARRHLIDTIGSLRAGMHHWR